MNLTSDELLALARFIDIFAKEALDRMSSKDIQHLCSATEKMLDYIQAERERKLQALEGFYDPLR